MSECLGGDITFIIGSSTYSTKGDFEVSYGASVREPVISGGKVVGHTKKLAKPPSIRGKVYITSELTPEMILNMESETVSLRLASGRIFSLAKAWSVNEDGGKLSTEDSTMDIYIAGKSYKMST
jgi:hypothetical protein